MRLSLAFTDPIICCGNAKMSKKKGLTPLCLALAASLAAPMATAQNYETQDNIDSTNISRGQIGTSSIYMPGSTVPTGTTFVPPVDVPTSSQNPAGGAAQAPAPAPAPALCHQYCYQGTHEHDGPN